MGSNAVSPQTWLITGCSSGFGENLVHSALARGDKVIATGRNLANGKLKHLEGTGAILLELDVTWPEEQVKSVIDATVQAHGCIDILVNNAGITSFGTFEEFRNDAFQKVYNTNFLGALSVTRAVLPHMRAQKSGILAFVGSMFGWWGPAFAAPYAAAKGALEMAVDSLSVEVAAFGIRSIIFEPGFAATDLTNPSKDHVSRPRDEHAIAEYAPVHQMMKQAEELFYVPPGDAKKMAERMVDVLRGEGFARGRSLPLRLPLGSDAVRIMEGKCRETLALIEAWKAGVVDTDRDDWKENVMFNAVTTVPKFQL